MGVVHKEHASEKLVEQFLHSLDLFDTDINYSNCWSEFRALHRLASDQVEMEWTTFSLAMCRLLFAISYSQKPKSILILGSHVGFSTLWLIGDRRHPDGQMKADQIICVDPDASSNEFAKRNCQLLGHENRVSVLTTTGQEYLANCPGGIDLALIDIDAPDVGKAGYVEMLHLLRPKLARGGLILAHDTLVPRFSRSMEAYHLAVDEAPELLAPQIIPIDDCGLTIARNRI